MAILFTLLSERVNLVSSKRISYLHIYWVDIGTETNPWTFKIGLWPFSFTPSNQLDRMWNNHPIQCMVLRFFSLSALFKQCYNTQIFFLRGYSILHIIACQCARLLFALVSAHDIATGNNSNKNSLFAIRLQYILP